MTLLHTTMLMLTASCALMLIGFGAAGASLRRRRSHKVIPQFA